jgi:hypothetical protein
MAHSWLGGIWNTGMSLPRPICFLTYAVTVAANWKNGCVKCPSQCTSSQPNTCECSISNELRCIADKAFLPIPTYGDFADVWTSPNDPIFFFHHANVDRHFMTWQLQQNATQGNDFAGFPSTSIPCYGHGLHDVMSSNNPFMSGLVNSIGQNGQEYPLTVFDVLNTTANGMIYTYDTI